MTDWQPREFEEIPTAQAARRLGINWCTWMGDWFTSWSPRNDNSNAEGTWAEWVNLAILILQDPMTDTVRPDAHKLAAQLVAVDFGASRNLTDPELCARFAPKTTEPTP